jgi:acyl carrier protein
MKINPRLQTIVAKHFNKAASKIKLDTSKDNLEDWDSLEHIKLILDIEDEFKIKFQLDVIPQMISVKSIQEELEKKFK